MAIQRTIMESTPCLATVLTSPNPFKASRRFRIPALYAIPSCGGKIVSVSEVMVLAHAHSLYRPVVCCFSFCFVYLVGQNCTRTPLQAFSGSSYSASACAQQCGHWTVDCGEGTSCGSVGGVAFFFPPTPPKSGCQCQGFGSELVDLSSVCGLSAEKDHISLSSMNTEPQLLTVDVVLQ